MASNAPHPEDRARPTRGASVSEGRPPWAGVVLLAAVLLAVSAFWSVQAPFGYWVNEIGGVEAWNENDPGTFYVASAHELAWGEAPLFVGHPGVPMVLLLRGLQEGLHAAFAQDGEAFTAFVARRLPLVHVASKMASTGVHLASFWALYALAMHLFANRRIAAWTVFGYASSLPVLYYLSRVSVEPWMVLCFAGSFVAMWKAQERTVVAEQLGFAALAAAVAVSGATSKLSFLGPLPGFLGLALLLGPGGLRERLRMIAAFAVSGVATLAFYSGVVDWADFVREWSIYARMPSSGEFTAGDLLPGLGAHRILLAAELPFVAVSLAGVVAFLRLLGLAYRPPLWFLGYGVWAFAFFAYRVGLEGSFLPFHYFFVPQAVLAVFFGFALAEAERRILPGASGPLLVGTTCAVLIAVHGIGAFAVIGSRAHDASVYATRRPAFERLAGLGPDERLGVVFADEPIPLRRALLPIHGIEFPTPWGVRDSVLRKEFTRRFRVVARHRVPPGVEGTYVPALGAELFVLRNTR